MYINYQKISRNVRAMAMCSILNITSLCWLVHIHISGAWHPSSSYRLLHRVLMYKCCSTALSLRKKLTTSSANFEWCHVHSVAIHTVHLINRVIWPDKNSMELFFHFQSTWIRDWASPHHEHPVCQSSAGYTEKLTNIWSRYFGKNRIIDNWHLCLKMIWRKRNFLMNN